MTKTAGLSQQLLCHISPVAAGAKEVPSKCCVSSSVHDDFP